MPTALTRPTKPTPPLLAVVCLVLNALIWGVAWWPLKQLGVAGVHPLWATFAFSIVGALVVGSYLKPQWRALWTDKRLLLLGVSSGLTNVCFNWGVALGDVVRVVLLFYFMPAWVTLIQWVWLSHRPSWRSMAQLSLSLLGMMMVLKKPDAPWPWPHGLADWLGLAGGFCFGMTNVLLQQLRKAPQAVRMQAMFFGGTVINGLALLAAMAAGLASGLPAHIGAWLGWLLLFCVMGFVGNVTMQYGAARVPANTTSLIMLSEVVFATVSAVAAGVAVLTGSIAVGGLLIVAAALWSVLSHQR